MKRIFVIILTCCLVLFLSGCEALDYTFASIRYQLGHYERAYELYDSLDDYADSEAMTVISRKKADYAAAEAYYAAGEYEKAMELFSSLDMYMDSPVKEVESRYALCCKLLAEGDYRRALPLWESLGAYEDSEHQTQKTVLFWLMEALAETGDVTLVLDAETGTQLRLVVTGSDSVGLMYESKGLLLGVPHESNFILYLHPLTKTANYSANYTSTATRNILEKAVGKVEPAVYSVRQGLYTTAFVQTITEADGTQTVTYDTTDAIILQSLLPEAATVISENFAALLELTGTDITPEQLGFLSLN